MPINDIMPFTARTLIFSSSPATRKHDIPIGSGAGLANIGSEYLHCGNLQAGSHGKLVRSGLIVGWFDVFMLLLLGLLVSGCANQGGIENLTAPEVQTVWPLPPEQPRVRYLGSLKFLEDVTGKPEQSLVTRLLGKKQENHGLLTKPYGVHSDGNGRVYVTDTGFAGLIVFDLNDKSVLYWGDSGPGALSKPIGVTSDADGNVYVSDVVDKRVVVFDKNGKFINAMGGKDLLISPAGLVFNNVNQLLYLVDVKKHQIVVFNRNGEVEFTIGERGSEQGKFNYPTNIAVDSRGQSIFVADTLNFRIQIFDAEGNFISSFGKNGNGPGNFSRLKGVAVDTVGHVYAVDAAFNNFQVLGQDGNLLLAIGRAGTDAAGFYLPAGAHVDGDNRIFIVDQYNQRIQMFEYIGPVEEN